MQFDPQYIVFALFAAVAIYFITRVSRFGFKGAIVGRRIERTLGEVDGSKSTFIKRKLRVHVLEDGDPSRAVGLEETASTMGSWQMDITALSADDARTLGRLLIDAADRR
jgi:hypothetical protein